jgi:uncharacterized protein YndB with AHSA1/START domain
MQTKQEETGHKEDRIAKAAVMIDAPVEKVWNGLVSPAVIQKYMAGAKVVSDWKGGSPIVWKGEWKGKPYEDKGSDDRRAVNLTPRLLPSGVHQSGT